MNIITHTIDAIRRPAASVVFALTIIFGGFCVTNTASAVTLFDTGLDPTATYPRSLESVQSLASKFTLSTAATVTDIEAYVLIVTGGDVAVELWSDDGAVPGTNLFSTSVTLTGGELAFDWKMFGGLNWALTAGSYWIVLDSETIGGIHGTWRGAALNPLADAVNANDGPWISEVLSLALRVNGTPEISTVPVPAALPLFGTGLAIMGFIGWRRKRKSA